MTQCSVVVSPLPTLVVAAIEAITGVGVALAVAAGRDVRTLRAE